MKPYNTEMNGVKVTVIKDTTSPKGSKVTVTSNDGETAMFKQVDGDGDGEMIVKRSSKATSAEFLTAIPVGLAGELDAQTYRLARWPVKLPFTVKATSIPTFDPEAKLEVVDVWLENKGGTVFVPVARRAESFVAAALAHYVATPAGEQAAIEYIRSVINADAPEGEEIEVTVEGVAAGK
jgi:hypothetical protein